jgi:glutamine amidotransferase
LIGLIDYGMGNVRSVLNALEHLGAEAELVDSPQKAAAAEKLILPGVGAFGEGMRRLDEAGLAEALPGLAGNGRPMLGICLGMQLLADASSEHGEHAGLGLIGGRVERIETAASLRIPHVGWNTLAIERSSELFAGLAPEPTFYFVHSYEFRTSASGARTATTDYGAPLTACVEQGSVFGVQFHPEKSQADGLALLRNFVGL